MAKQIEKITSRNEDFAKWYTDVVLNANLADYGSVKGTMIFKPYGYAIWENIQSILDKEFKKHNVSNVYFPLLIPKSIFLKESDHIEGFAPELATVTKVGDKILEEELYIRPTSEVPIMHHFEKEVKSYRDLPLLYNQWANVMRWEKTTRPFLRTSEFLWQEGHTVHSTEKEARQMTETILQVYKKFAEDACCLPVVAGRKTEQEKFAGAQETYTIESMMYDGQSLQVGTSHYFGDNFTKAFNIKFQNKEQKEEFGYTTSWGLSTRMIGAIIMTHSDDQGLVLPTKLAPTQIQIIKISDSKEIDTAIKKIKTSLKDYRVNVDESEKSFGFKISEAEIKGIPIRIEIGPRDLENNQVIVSRRDTRTKTAVDLKDLKKFIVSELVEYDKNIFNMALQNRTDRTFEAETIAEYKDLLDKKLGFVLVPFCGEKECEEDVKQKTQTNSRCIPTGIKQEKGKCFNCKKDSNTRTYFAKAY